MSLHKSVPVYTWWPELEPQNLHHGERKLTSTSCPLTLTHVQLLLHPQNKWERKDNSLDLWVPFFLHVLFLRWKFNHWIHPGSAAIYAPLEGLPLLPCEALGHHSFSDLVTPSLHLAQDMYTHNAVTPKQPTRAPMCYWQSSSQVLSPSH